MILAVRNAAFISHGQLFSQLASQGTESNRQGFCWRLKRLVDAGLIQRLPQIMPYSGATYTITRAGLVCLESCGEGLVSITSDSRSLPNRLRTIWNWAKSEAPSEKPEFCAGGSRISNFDL
jgi:hypothetical protein